MIPQLCPDGMADSIKRSQVMNRYLKHATISELQRLIDEAKSCLEMNEAEVIEIPSGFKGGFFSNIFESRLYVDHHGKISEWNGTIGRPPTKVLNSDYAQYRKIEFTVKKNLASELTATGFRKYKKSEKTKQLFSILGLLIVCFGQPIEELSYISQMRKPALDSLINEVVDEFGVELTINNGRYCIERMGSYLNPDPLPYLKVAFPSGVVIRHGVPYQIF